MEKMITESAVSTAPALTWRTTDRQWVHTDIAGKQRSWLLEKIVNVVTGRPTTVVVKGVPLNAMHHFEDLLARLSVTQTRLMLSHGMSTMLAHVSDQDESNATVIRQHVDSIKFTSGNAHHVRDGIKHIQMLHYRSILLDRLVDDEFLPQSAFEEDKQAEVLVTYKKQDDGRTDDIVRTILHVRWNSPAEFQRGGSVVVKDVNCTGFDSNENSRPTISVDVTFQFALSEDAAQFHREWEAIRMDLFVIHLRYPRKDESVRFKV
ncbi:hypothetical protein CEP52_016148 [Fusarium oligoseptatum]|uniref:Uncharacterized protein n=1 Tax=Fusarium oligoseptatum TaxID=2604345 RepID=A0A428S6K3_9HYPO|nr:hypothetical protein CEP52_016148 [Fusarium oligoseptatum]